MTEQTSSLILNIDKNDSEIEDETKIISTEIDDSFNSPSQPMQAKTIVPMKLWVVAFLILALLSLLISSQNGCKLSAVDLSFHESKEWDSDALPSTGNATHKVDWGWCPDAKCYSSPVCHPCQRRFLIIITNGRSASTTLTWMMSLLPGVRMGGENNNAVQKIMTMIQEVTAPPFQLKPPASAKFSAWDHHPIYDGSLACVAQKMIETIVPPPLINRTHVDPDEGNDIVGFKTIRLLRDNTIADVPAIAKFLIESFPCARYLINYRSDFVHQAQSQVTALASYKNEKNDIDGAVERISKEVDRLKKLGKLLGHRAMTLDSAKWTEDVGELNKAVRWLGFHETCAFPKLMELNTGRSNPHNRRLESEATDIHPTSEADHSFPKKTKRRVRGLSDNNSKSSGNWLTNSVSKNKTKPKASQTTKSYQHSQTDVELDPQCRYVGS